MSVQDTGFARNLMHGGVNKHGRGFNRMMAGERCITHNLWEDLGDEIHRYLAGVSLEDVVMNRTGARRRTGVSDAGTGIGVAA